MSQYAVEIPIAGSMTIMLEADNEDDALAKAWERYEGSGPDDFEISWDALEVTANGNVNHCPCSEQSAQKVDR